MKRVTIHKWARWLSRQGAEETVATTLRLPWSQEPQLRSTNCCEVRLRLQWSQSFTIFHENPRALKHDTDNTKQGPWTVLTWKPSVYNPWHLCLSYFILNNLALKTFQDIWEREHVKNEAHRLKLGSNPGSTTYSLWVLQQCHSPPRPLDLYHISIKWKLNNLWHFKIGMQTG